MRLVIDMIGPTFLALCTTALAQTPGDWAAMWGGRPISARKGDLTNYSWTSTIWVPRVDSSGRYLYTDETRYDFQTGASRGFGLYIINEGDYPYSLQLLWLDHLPADAQEHPFDMILWADADKLAVYSTAAHTWKETYFFGEIGGPPRPTFDPLPEPISRLITFNEEGSSYLDPELWNVPRRGGASVSPPAKLVGTKLVPYHALIDGVDWATGEAWFYVSAPHPKTPPISSGIAEIAFRGKKATRVLPSPDFPPGEWLQGYMLLADHSIVASKEIPDPAKRPTWMKSDHASVVYDPKVNRWLHFDGLIVAGASTDGKYVAYLLPPWKEIHLAKVLPSPAPSRSARPRSPGPRG